MIIIKSTEEIVKMRRAGKVTALVLQKLRQETRVGVTTAHLDHMAVQELNKLGAKSSFKGYRGFPASVCVSVNDEIVHGIPGNRIIQDGDIVSIDFGAVVDGFQGDAAVTVPVGNVSTEAARLVETTEGALMAAIAVVSGGARLGDIGAAIQEYAESRGFSVVREYTGHGIGRDMHEDPFVPNFGLRGEGTRLRPGMTMALEPMINTGTWRTKLSENKWTVLTEDGGLSAHFEHTIAVTSDGAEVLTCA